MGRWRTKPGWEANGEREQQERLQVAANAPSSIIEGDRLCDDVACVQWVIQGNGGALGSRPPAAGLRITTFSVLCVNANFSMTTACIYARRCNEYLMLTLSRCISNQ